VKLSSCRAAGYLDLLTSDNNGSVVPATRVRATRTRSSMDLQHPPPTQQIARVDRFQLLIGRLVNIVVCVSRSDHWSKLQGDPSSADHLWCKSMHANATKASFGFYAGFLACSAHM